MEKRTLRAKFRNYAGHAYSGWRIRRRQRDRFGSKVFVPPGPLFDVSVVALLLVFGSLYFLR